MLATDCERLFVLSLCHSGLCTTPESFHRHFAEGTRLVNLARDLESVSLLKWQRRARHWTLTNDGLAALGELRQPPTRLALVLSDSNTLIPLWRSHWSPLLVALALGALGGLLTLAFLFLALQLIDYVATSTTIMIIILCATSALLGAGIAVRSCWYHMIARSLLTQDGTLQINQTQLLGLVPQSSDADIMLQMAHTEFGQHGDVAMADAFRVIRGRLVHLFGGGHHSLLVVGGLPGSGASFVALNIARSFASLDRRVLLVDANLRRPALHTYVDALDAPGLTEVLAGLCPIDQAVRPVQSHLDILVAGDRKLRRYDALQSSAMHDMLESARLTYELVICDVAPLTVAGDALTLASQCSSSLLVLRNGAEARSLGIRLSRDLSKCAAQFLGIVVNGVSMVGARSAFRRRHNYHMTNAVHSESRERTAT